ncbi:MAG TPA: hypothetical protein VMT59_02300 [Gaiellaceae bacterium]|nr:hypothetical protein [Gaiellaceae bacterium]
MTDPAERKRWKIGRPSPALIVAVLALFVSLTGSAVAAGVVPLAKRALTADTAKNSLKLGGLTAAQVGSLAPPPNIYYKTAPWTLTAGSDPTDFTTSCDPGEHVLSGGYDNPDGNALAQDTHPTADGLGWVVNLQNLSPSSDTSGTLYAVCLR